MYFAGIIGTFMFEFILNLDALRNTFKLSYATRSNVYILNLHIESFTIDPKFKHSRNTSNNQRAEYIQRKL